MVEKDGGKVRDEGKKGRDGEARKWRMEQPGGLLLLSVRPLFSLQSFISTY